MADDLSPQLGGVGATGDEPMLSHAHRYCKRCKQYPQNDALHTIAIGNITLEDALCDQCYAYFQRYVQAMAQGQFSLGETVRTETGIQVTATYRFRAPRE